MGRKGLVILGKTALYIVLTIMALITLFPVIYTILGSFKTTQEVLASSSLLPKKLIVDNFVQVWNTINFSKYTLNSIILSVSVVFGNLILLSMTAYVLERKRDLFGRKLIYSVYVSSVFISVPIATIYPIFQLVVGLNLNNTLMGLILVMMAGEITGIFLIEGYLRGISKEIDESARIDGCGFFAIYYRMILPLIKPILATVGLFTFRSSWNAYLLPLVLTMGNKDITPLTVAIVGLKSSGEVASNWAVMLAGASISLVPMIIAYIFANKLFIAGITEGAVKG